MASTSSNAVPPLLRALRELRRLDAAEHAVARGSRERLELRRRIAAQRVLVLRLADVRPVPS